MIVTVLMSVIGNYLIITTSIIILSTIKTKTKIKTKNRNSSFCSEYIYMLFNYILLNIEGPRVEVETPPSKHRVLLCRQCSCHELAHRKGCYLHQNGGVLNMKRVLRKIKIVQDVKPRNHARNVITGRVGPSVSGTTSATSSTGHLS